MPNTSIDAIHGFLGARSIAIAGVSRNPKDYSRIVYEELRQRGYEVAAVNPAVDFVNDVKFVASVDQVSPPAEAVVILVPEAHLLETTRACVRAGARYVWFRHKESSSPVYQQAASEARDAGLTVIAGECPLMFLPNGAWIHRAHATLRQWTGSYPC
jgi:uncharacterized protein